MLNIAIQLNSEIGISECLVNLEKLMADGCLPMWPSVSSIAETLDKLPTRFSALSNGIKEHLKKVKA